MPVYHSQANPTERRNQEIKKGIRLYIFENHRIWDLHLPQILFDLRYRRNKATGMTPNQQGQDALKERNDMEDPIHGAQQRHEKRGATRSSTNSAICKELGRNLPSSNVNFSTQRNDRNHTTEFYGPPKNQSAEMKPGVVKCDVSRLKCATSANTKAHNSHVASRRGSGLSAIPTAHHLVATSHHASAPFIALLPARGSHSWGQDSPSDPTGPNKRAASRPCISRCLSTLLATPPSGNKRVSTTAVSPPLTATLHRALLSSTYPPSTPWVTPNALGRRRRKTIPEYLSNRKQLLRNIPGPASLTQRVGKSPSSQENTWGHPLTDRAVLAILREHRGVSKHFLLHFNNRGDDNDAPDEDWNP
uniref:Integrase catalytic domain-containing protein n=1 Tax=Timema poppense TaxID=170557 RepID=A0A7R9DHM5_TIMPO|nr:unnamed protein product [Timema poppensis]